MGLIGRLIGQLLNRSATVARAAPASTALELRHQEYFSNGQEAFLDGRLDEAKLWFGKLKAENTNLGIAWVFLGHLAKADTSHSDHQVRALECYARARSLQFDSIELALNIATIYLDQERGPEALRELAHVREKGAQIPQWYFHFGRAQELEFNFEGAHSAYHTAVHLAGDFMQARVARALVLAWMGRFAACVEALRELTQHGLTPIDVARKLTLIGWLIGYSELVEESARMVLEHAPDDKDAQFGLGNVLIAKGNFADGWRLIEARIDNPIYPRYRPVLPRWQGEDLAAKHLWVFEEQGFGDEILFARFLPLLAERVGRLTLQCKPELHRLLSSIPGIDCVPHKGRMPAGAMAADFELPLLSIPARLNIVDPAVLAKLPPIAVSENLAIRWQQIVSEAVTARAAQNIRLARRPRIGLAISGAAHRKDNQLRSVPSHCLDAIIAQDCDFFWIQPVSDHADEATLPTRVIDLTTDLNDFADTGALLLQLDLVITVDTAVAHLAGTLGIETWLLLPRMRDWRWEIEGFDCLWYPRIRSWRVAENLDWQRLVDEVGDALKIRIKQGFERSGSALNTGTS